MLPARNSAFQDGEAESGVLFLFPLCPRTTLRVRKAVRASAVEPVPPCCDSEMPLSLSQVSQGSRSRWPSCPVRPRTKAQQSESRPGSSRVGIQERAIKEGEGPHGHPTTPGARGALTVPWVPWGCPGHQGPQPCATGNWARPSSAAERLHSHRPPFSCPGQEGHAKPAPSGSPCYPPAIACKFGPRVPLENWTRIRRRQRLTGQML